MKRSERIRIDVVAGTVIFMDNGEIIEKGSPAGLFDAPREESTGASFSTYCERP